MIDWRIIPGFPDYEISSFGHVRRATMAENGKPIGTPIKQQLANTGYWYVKLGRKGERTGQFTHRLMALAFIGPAPSQDHQVAHNDGSRVNNCVENLRWATVTENHADKHIHGTQPFGETMASAKLTARAVMAIRSKYANGGVSYAKLGQIYGIAEGTVGQIVRCDIWKRLPTAVTVSANEFAS